VGAGREARPVVDEPREGATAAGGDGHRRGRAYGESDRMERDRKEEAASEFFYF
jgi:hypothetical protein